MNKTLTTAETSNPKKLTRSERKEWEEQFSRWHTPAEMEAAVRELHEQLESEVLFNQGGLNFALEGWTAVHFARDRGDQAVRLIPDVWPDIEVRSRGRKIEKFEAVEADMPGRRRGLEYKEAAAMRLRGESPVWHAPEEPSRRALIETALRAAVAKKLSKHYSGRCNLLIMLNFGGEFGKGEREIAAIVHPSTVEARDHFDEVWLLWREAAYLLWRNGERIEIELKPGYRVL